MSNFQSSLKNLEKFSQLSYDVVLPAHLLVHPDIEPNAKIFYGFVRNLTKIEGYCYATNKYLSELMDVEVRTIQYWLESLQKYGYLEIEIENGQIGSKRKIYISDKFKKCLQDEKPFTPPMQKVSPPHAKNFTHKEDIKKEERTTTREDVVASSKDTEGIEESLKKGGIPPDKIAVGVDWWNKYKDDINEKSDNPIGYLIWMVKQNINPFKDKENKQHKIELRKQWAETHEWSSNSGSAMATRSGYEVISGSIATLYPYDVDSDFWKSRGL